MILTITEHLASTSTRFTAPRVELKDPAALARFHDLDAKIEEARLALAEAEAALYGLDVGPLRQLASLTHRRTRNARQGMRPTP